METIEWLSRLVAFDTVSKNSNLALINEINNWFTYHGLETRLSYDAIEPKANLFATIPAQNGHTNGGILLSGHTDVVPVDAQDWRSDPFQIKQVEDKIFGRGTCDMKGFLAVLLALVPHFKQLPLQEPVHFAFSYDEEIGCRGAPLLIDDLKKANIQPRLCIVGEPTNMQVVQGHKGIGVYRCRVHGKAVHSSLTPLGCNAIEHAASWIAHLREYAEKMRIDGPFDQHYDVPFTTLSVNKIAGGTAYNIVPEYAEFILERRNLSSVNPRDIEKHIETFIQNHLLKTLHHESNDATIEFLRLAEAPSFESTATTMIAKMQQLLEDTGTHKVAYATEAGLFQAANIETIVCGPGSIEEAHRANEFVTVTQLARCEKFLREVVQLN